MSNTDMNTRLRHGFRIVSYAELPPRWLINHTHLSNTSYLSCTSSSTRWFKWIVCVWRLAEQSLSLMCVISTIHLLYYHSSPAQKEDSSDNSQAWLQYLGKRISSLKDWTVWLHSKFYINKTNQELKCYS